jgi:hypothetical protein
MESFLKFYDSIREEYGFCLNISQSNISDWNIKIVYKKTHSRHGETVLDIQNCDVEYVFAKAQVLLKEYMKDIYGGY